MLMASVSRSRVFTRYERSSSQEMRVKRSMRRDWRVASASQCDHSMPFHLAESSPKRETTVCGVKSARVKKYGEGSRLGSSHAETALGNASGAPRKTFEGLMRGAGINFGALEAGGAKLARKFWKEASHGREPRDLRRGTKGSVAAEKFVAAQAGERHFQSRLARRPGNEISIDSVHAGLIEGGDGFIEARFHVTARESHLAMFGPQALGSLARDFRFAEFGVGEGNSESVNAFLHVAGQRGQ